MGKRWGLADAAGSSGKDLCTFSITHEGAGNRVRPTY